MISEKIRKLCGCVLVCAAGALVLGPGCADEGGDGDDGDDGGDKGCQSNGDCAGDKICSEGACILPGGTGGAGTGGTGNSGPTSGTGAGGTCTATNDPCNVNGDCCSFNQGSGYCFAGACSDACNASSECSSGCCVPLEGGGSTCAGGSVCSDCMGLTFAGTCLDDIVVWCDGGLQMINCGALGGSCGYNSEAGVYDCF